jgi:hypothetical protein
MVDAPQTDEPQTDATDADSPAVAVADTLDERPEILVGAAFLGGFVLAQILKKVGE